MLTPTASPVPVGRHVARHGFGYTTYSHAGRGLRLELTQTLGGDDPVKLSFLSITNTGRSRSAAAGHLVRRARPGLRPGRHGGTSSEVEPGGAVVVTNPWSTGSPDQSVGFDLVGPRLRRRSVTV